MLLSVVCYVFHIHRVLVLFYSLSIYRVPMQNASNSTTRVEDFIRINVSA